MRNGGGKSVLVQMIMSQFVNKSYRDLGDRQFKSYFTTNRPTFIMTEWQLDNNVTRFLSGMMVRKNQKEDNDAEELEMYTFTGSYSEGCHYDIDNIPVVKQDGNRKILKGFMECKKLFEDISKDKKGDFRIYDMGSSYGRRQYFGTLRQYQINNKEWESIIRKVNQKESGLSELFSNSKDEKDLVENWFLKPIEDKLNQEKNRIDEFRKLTFQFIEQYRSNQSKIEKKALIEKYFEDTKSFKEDIDRYVRLDEDRCEHTARMALYVKKLNEAIEILTANLDDKSNLLLEIEKYINQILYEKISYEIYRYIDCKDEAVSERSVQEVEITRLKNAQDKLTRQLSIYDCNKLYQELKDIKAEKGTDTLAHFDKENKDKPVHTVSVSGGSLLAGMVGAGELTVNSVHHQAVRDLGRGMVLTAVSPDGVAEAIEAAAGFVVGVQWHPEVLSQHDEVQDKIFAEFVGMCQKGTEPAVA